jgi:hypothetical protein
MESQEAMMKQKLNALNQAQYADGATIGTCQDMPMREGLLSRVKDRAARANRDRLRSERLQELAYLLDKNPEVARILELMEEM